MIRNCLFVLNIALFSCALWSGEAPVMPQPQPDVKPAAEKDPNPKPGSSENPPLTLQPVLFTVEADGESLISFKESEPTKLLGGVRLGYEEVKISCDHIHYWMSQLPGVKRATLDHALLDQGPDSAVPGKVVFDSRNSKLSQVGFRGLLQPKQVEVIRQPFNEEDPKHVKYHVLMHEVGDFSGDLQTADGWVPHAGWAEEAQFILIADITEGGVANPRFSEVILSGRPADHAEGRKSARIERLKQQIDDPNAVKIIGSKQIDGWTESDFFHIWYDDMGRVQRMKSGPHSKSGGTQSLDLLIYDSSPDQPTENTPPPKSGEPTEKNSDTSGQPKQ